MLLIQGIMLVLLFISSKSNYLTAHLRHDLRTERNQKQ